MYRDKTMGVISLLGDHQAKLIERLLLKRIGAEEIERRRIVCGDAYSFQGDERHVIFLSLVVAVKDDESRGFTALTKVSDMQRFNVAASRAQDQLWLFHSVMPEDIGNHECMRHRLLTYFYDPARHTARCMGIDLSELRRQAAMVDRPESAPAPFDSWFEVDVYLRIADRGFRVLPQYRAGRHNIDLVVEGKTRLAVECDGDHWHGPERFDEDMARQRQLERAQWRFHRLRGSAFYRDPDAALAALWARLADLGIDPMSAEDGTISTDGHVPQISPRQATYEVPVDSITGESGEGSHAGSSAVESGGIRPSAAGPSPTGSALPEDSVRAIVQLLRRSKVPLTADRIAMSLEISRTVCDAFLGRLVISGDVQLTDTKRGTGYVLP